MPLEDYKGRDLLSGAVEERANNGPIVETNTNDFERGVVAPVNLSFEQQPAFRAVVCRIYEAQAVEAGLAQGSSFRADELAAAGTVRREDEVEDRVRKVLNMMSHVKP